MYTHPLLQTTCLPFLLIRRLSKISQSQLSRRWKFWWNTFLIDQNISCQQLIQSRLHFDTTQANLESFNGPQIDTPQTPSTTSAILTGASFWLTYWCYLYHIPLIPKCSCFHTMDIPCFSFQIPGLENQRSRSLWPIEQKEEVGTKNGCLPHVWKSRCSGRSSRSCSYRSSIENGGPALIETRCLNINIHMDSIHFAIFWAFEDPGGQNIE